MKYGRIVFTREYVSPTVCNAGDIVQIMAIDEIYRRMGITQQQITDIPMEELGGYRGEPVLLPINGYFLYSKKYPAFPVSKQITPVFLGVFTTSNQYLKHRIFWKRYEPICCRDEASYHAMKKRGYRAYLTGCMTLTLPKREKQPSKRKIFLADAYPGIEAYIPKEFKAAIEYVTHDIPVDKHLSKAELARSMRDVAEKMYARYRDEATLVVTSRLHCAAPCLAMGIPVIVVKDGYDERFGWLDKFIHLYTPDEFDKIDWYPKPVDLEDHKERLIRVAISMIRQQPDEEALSVVHDFYMNRDRKKLATPILVKGYMWLSQYTPSLASFIREKLLFRFSIAGKSRMDLKKGEQR